MSTRDMKIFLLLLIALTLPAFASKQKNCAEYLKLNDSGLTLNAIPYDKLNYRVFRDALDRDFKTAKKNLKKLHLTTEEPTFANTIEAIEFMDQDFVTSWQIFEIYKALMSTNGQTKKLEHLYSVYAPRAAALEASIFLNNALFKRVETVYNNRYKLNLTPEEIRLTEIAYKGFIRRGVNLTEDKKMKVTAISRRLTLATEYFESNIRKEADSLFLIITNPEDLKGFPENIIDVAKEEAEEKNIKNSWIFSVKPASYVPFMGYTENRKLRKKLWTLRSKQNASGANDNRILALEIAKLRQEYAKILGYENYAEMTLVNRMAKTPETVKNFLKRLTEVYKESAKKDLAELRDFAGHEIEPWDSAYYSRKLKEQRYSYDENKLKNYFSLEKVLEAVFDTAKRLYGVQFLSRTDLPTWHKDVRVFEVRDKNDKLLSLFYLDPFPRTGKSNGAFCAYLRPSGVYKNEMLRPHVVNMTNSPKPTANTPSLLKLSDALTVAHELGHGLHQILSTVKYTSMSGTSVMRDGVELPSQLNELWLFEKEVLNQFAKHYETGEVIPEELVDKVLSAKNFQAGINGLRQTQYISLDMAWYTADLSNIHTVEDVKAFEDQALSEYRLLPAYDSLLSASMAHIFSGGYSAGYYGYKWAEVLAADAFELFKENGIFDQDTAAKFMNHVLSQGNLEDFDVLYKKFRGQDPDPDALLRSEGLIP